MTINRQDEESLGVLFAVVGEKHGCFHSKTRTLAVICSMYVATKLEKHDQSEKKIDMAIAL